MMTRRFVGIVLTSSLSVARRGYQFGMNTSQTVEWGCPEQF